MPSASLLFQKFAFDASEKYRKETMVLTTDAEQLLMNYRWPGNIRQLKNIAEQVAVLEQGHVLDATALLKYMPERADNNLPALYKGKKESSDFSERDIFYKVLIDLKSDVAELKKVVFGLIENNEIDPNYVEENKAVISSVLSDGFGSTSLEAPKVVEESSAEEIHEHVVIDASNTVSDTEDLSIEAKEEELIRKALLKNNGRRKRAAQDLGISERTLYRKIKQYEIDM